MARAPVLTSPSAATTIEGVLERIAFASEENAWSVVKLVVAGRPELVTAVGNLLGVQPGESLRLTGHWATEKKYGEQFKVESYITVKPATLVGIEKYLGSGLVRGVGKVMAERLVAHFGMETLEVIDQKPERLPEVEGIGPVRSERITTAWVEQRQIKDVMVFLQSHGVSTAYASRPIRIDIERAITWFEAQVNIELAGEQKEAIRKAATSKLLVVTGGPGTGKTTLVNGIIRILEMKGRRILLAAPTGRAAKRMAETTGREAKTIHRLLEFNPKKFAFDRDANNPLEADLVILDEASMIDTVLAYNVLQAIPFHCQLVLVGDIDQLPSVGPGSVLGDVIRSGVADVVRLRHIFRQGTGSLIVSNAHRVNEGLMPELPGEGAKADFFFIERDEPEEIAATLKALVRQHIPNKFGLDPVDDIQVLTPMQRGLLGVANVNAELQALLNPSGDTLVRGSRSFRVGDKVMQIKNNYDLNVFNGDIGRIRKIDGIEQEVHVEFDGRAVMFDYADLDELVLAYACSIHKSQGSEYPCVVIPVHTQHYMMLQRNLLYTAITRGKRLVVLVGSKRALAIAVKNNAVEERCTMLAERLRGGAAYKSNDEVTA